MLVAVGAQDTATVGLAPRPASGGLESPKLKGLRRSDLHVGAMSKSKEFQRLLSPVSVDFMLCRGILTKDSQNVRFY